MADEPAIAAGFDRRPPGQHLVEWHFEYLAEIVRPEAVERRGNGKWDDVSNRTLGH